MDDGSYNIRVAALPKKGTTLGFSLTVDLPVCTGGGGGGGGNGPEGKPGGGDPNAVGGC